MWKPQWRKNYSTKARSYKVDRWQVAGIIALIIAIGVGWYHPYAALGVVVGVPAGIVLTIVALRHLAFFGKLPAKLFKMDFGETIIYDNKGRVINVFPGKPLRPSTRKNHQKIVADFEAFKAQHPEMSLEAIAPEIDTTRETLAAALRNKRLGRL